MIRFIVTLILISLVLRSVIRLWQGIAEGLQGPPAPKPPPAVPLVRDPVCGIFVVPANALTSGAGAQMKFFCSENCRRAYAGRERKGPNGGARASAASLSEAPDKIAR